MTAELFLTTQPGWAFGTLAEIRTRGVRSYVGFYHRDSSLLVESSDVLLQAPLQAPADVYGCLLRAEGTNRQDASSALGQLLDTTDLRRQLLNWLPQMGDGRSRRFSIGSELWGDTAIHRKMLADLVRAAFHRAFPTWREEFSGGLRLFCKADANAAFLGVQLYSNLRQQDDGRPGALREHLACTLLTLARVESRDVVFDPFMGSGTILSAAWEQFGVATCFGLDVDPEAYAAARRNVRAPDARLVRASFERVDLRHLPEALKLVSNLPFGAHFSAVPTDSLLDFLIRLEPRIKGFALLMGREQAMDVGRALDLRAKNVLVLGQPASILSSAL